MKYLVTGGAGFIGGHLVEALVSLGRDVVVLDDLSTGKREHVPALAELVVGDVADAALVAKLMAEVDGCFHLAAIASVQRSVEDWVGCHRTNLSGAVAVLDAARPRRGTPTKPVVLASSAAVYGANSRGPIDESAPLRPLSAYGADKMGCELHGDVAANLFGIPVTALRFFNVFGPRQDPGSPYSGVISKFADCALRREAITVHGDGLQTRDFIYVGDVVRALIAAMERAAPEFAAINVCTGTPTRIIDIASAMAEITGCNLPVIHGDPRPGDIRYSLGNPSRMEAALGIRAQVSLEEGLARLVRQGTGRNSTAAE